MLLELLCIGASCVYINPDKSCHRLQVHLSLYQERMYRSPEYVKCQAASLNSLLQQHFQFGLGLASVLRDSFVWGVDVSEVSTLHL